VSDAIVYETIPPELMSLGYQYRRPRPGRDELLAQDTSDRRRRAGQHATAGGRSSAACSSWSRLTAGRTLVDGVRLVGYGWLWLCHGGCSRHFEVQQGGVEQGDIIPRSVERGSNVKSQLH
jgi:hypothetical protein